MLTMTILDKLWLDIAPQEGDNIGRRVDPGHPLDFFVGYSDSGDMQLVLLSSSAPELPPSNQHILVTENQRKDGKYALCFVLESRNLRDLFLSLCWDLIDSSYEVRSKDEGVLSVIRRFRKWQMLFSAGIGVKMSESVMRGLIGELWVLNNICALKYGANTAVDGWMGPLKADRDFEYSDTWYEVKTTSLSKDTIYISSLDQLDTDRGGFLVVCRVEEAVATCTAAVSIQSLVTCIQDALATDSHSASVFKARLSLSGYTEEDESTHKKFCVGKCEQFCVKGDFPRLRRSQLEPQIVQGEYQLSVAALQPWKSE